MYNYEFTDETRTVNGHVLYRIRATRDFCNVKKGELGGFLESFYNLNPFHRCWVAKNACVYGHAIVKNDALVTDDAIVGDSAVICDDCVVNGEAKIGGESHVGRLACVIFGLNSEDEEDENE